MNERKRTETLPRHSARDRRVCPPIYRRHGTGRGTGDARGEKGTWMDSLPVTVRDGSGPGCMPLPCFCGGLGRYFSFFSLYAHETSLCGPGEVRLLVFFVGCLVSYLNDAMASASLDRLCAILILVTYLMIERSD